MVRREEGTGRGGKGIGRRWRGRLWKLCLSSGSVVYHIVE